MVAKKTATSAKSSKTLVKTIKSKTIKAAPVSKVISKKGDTTSKKLTEKDEIPTLVSKKMNTWVKIQTAEGWKRMIKRERNNQKLKKAKT